MIYLFENKKRLAFREYERFGTSKTLTIQNLSPAFPNNTLYVHDLLEKLKKTKGNQSEICKLAEETPFSASYLITVYSQYFKPPLGFFARN